MVDSTAATSGAIATTEKNHLGWLFFLGLAPTMLLLGWISHYAVNVPIGDEWALVPLFEKWRSHQLTFHDLYQQHNEHRILIPKLIYLAFAHLTNWDLRAEMFFSVALCVGTSAGIYVLLRKTLGGPPRQLLLLWAAANLLIFSPTQAQNWLWGFQLQMFIPSLCLVLTLVILTSDSLWWPRFGASVVLIAVATFSFGSGLLLWPVIALFLVLRGESKWRIAAWLLVFALVVALYVPGYYRVPRAQPLTGDWLDYPRYFLVFIGGALSRGRGGGHLLLGAMIIGAVGLAVYAAIFVHFFRTRGEGLRNAAPWLVLAPYVMGSAVLAAYSRVNWGPNQAMDSRYVTNSNYFYLGLIVLAAIAMRDAEHRCSRFAGARLATKRAIIISVVALALAGFPAGLDDMATLQRQHLAGLGALQFSKVIDTTDSLRRDLKMVPGFVPSPSEYVAALERLHLLQYSRRGNAILEEAQRRRTRTPSEFGQVELKQHDPVTFEVSGWAILRESGQPAPLVALAYSDGERWIGFALSDVLEFRDDVVAKLHSRDYQASGWRKIFNRNVVPAQAERISAWAVDPLANEVHKLAGDYPLDQ